MIELDFEYWLTLAVKRGIGGKRALVVAHIASRAHESPDGCYVACQGRIGRITGVRHSQTITKAVQEAVAANILAEPKIHCEGLAGVRTGTRYRIAPGHSQKPQPHVRQRVRSAVRESEILTE